MKTALFKAGWSVLFVLSLSGVANALSINNGELFRGYFDFSSQPSPPVDVMVRFIDVTMTPDDGLEVWTVSLFDDPITLIGPSLTQNAANPVGPFTIGFGFSLNSPLSSGLPQELADQRGFFETIVTGGKLEYGSAFAVYHYFNQQSGPEITQELFFQPSNNFPEPVPEPGTLLLMGTGFAGLVSNSLKRKKK